jgi:hypothetical protein
MEHQVHEICQAIPRFYSILTDKYFSVHYVSRDASPHLDLHLKLYLITCQSQSPYNNTILTQSHTSSDKDITSNSLCPKNKHSLLTQSISKQILRREKQDIPAATAVQTFLNPVTPLHLSEAIFTLPYILGKILDGQTRDGKSVASPRPTHSI